MIPLLLVFAGLPAQADDQVPPAHTVIHYSVAPTRAVPSGKAKLMRLAGKEEGAKQAFFAVLELAPGAKVPVHRDATEEYIYMLQGTGEITIDGTTHSVKEGTGVFMPANAEVSFVATGQETVRVVQFFAGQGPEAKYDGWIAVPVPGQK
jgi:quercetin dioxygenase-like cupin family protein